MTNSKRLSLAAIVLLCAALAGYWYWSPFLAVRELQRAAQQGDADKFNAHVDYPRLRESLKTQLSVILSQKLGTSKEPASPMAALGNLIGSSLVGPLVDAMVRPETVMAALQNGRLAKSAAEAPAAVPPNSPPVPPAATGAAGATANPATEPGKTHWKIDRQGASRVTAYAVDPARPDEPDTDRLGLVFERSGFVDWKLTDIRLPLGNLGK